MGALRGGQPKRVCYDVIDNVPGIWRIVSPAALAKADP
jgi:hypothetical protein